ncbi:MFS transporter [Brevibacillus nitrificans]|uniref:MFS transporter n=1 Tax=Brevibacillus nitrificans TaxID=651560 RepID=A0A3M8CZU4_9BACL|nr:MFS transporter [Brevibacillus nitrificans]RNB81340.1 MFS transporter [Brevibacillus nitrificans]
MSRTVFIYLLALGEFMVGTSETIITGIIGMIATDTHVSLSLAGQLVTAFSLAFAFGSPLLISLSGRMDRKKLLLLAFNLFIAGNLAASLSPGFPLLMASRILLGLSGGVYTVVALAMSTQLASPEKRGSAIAIVLMGFSVSLVLGVPAGTIAGEFFGWRPVFALIACLSLVPCLAIGLYLPKVKGEVTIPLRTQLSALRNARVVYALLLSFFFVTGYSTVYTYITPLLQEAAEMTTALVSTALFLAGIASVAGSRIGGLATDRWGVRSTLYASLAVHILALLLLPLASQLIVTAMLITFLWIGAVQATVPAQQYYLITLSPGSAEIALSVNTSIFQLGIAAGAALGGIVASQNALLHLGWIGGGLVLIGLGFAWLSFFQARHSSPAKASQA